MPLQAITQSSDSQDPVTYALDERPALLLTPAASQAIAEEIDKARRAWLGYKIPTKTGPRRIAALAKEAQLRDRYFALMGKSSDDEIPF